LSPTIDSQLGYYLGDRCAIVGHGWIFCIVLGLNNTQREPVKFVQTSKGTVKKVGLLIPSVDLERAGAA
jgi:hypothetical protein